MSIQCNTFEFSPCPLCGSIDAIPKYTSRDLIAKLPGIYAVVRCTQCRLCRTQPRPLENCIKNFYPPDYGPYTNAKPSSEKRIYNSESQGHSHKLKAIFRATYRALGIYLPRTLPNIDRSPLRLLDYGCASGTYLNSLDRQKFRSTGVDFSSDALNEAKKLGLSVLPEPIHIDDFRPESFDIITSWMVLEHLYDPLYTLRKLHHWLAADGFIMISVPDFSAFHRSVFKGLSYDDQVPTHLIHFTPQTIVRMMNSAGFNVVEVRWQPNSRSLLMSIRNFLDAYFPAVVSQGYVLFLKSKIGGAFAYILGFALAIIRQSARIEVIANKANYTKSL